VEGPLTNLGTPEQDKTYVFRSPPAKVSAALRAAGFNVVSLANNHTLDYGADGLIQTIETLDAAGIQHTGAGADLMAARQPATDTSGRPESRNTRLFNDLAGEFFCRPGQGRHGLRA